MCEFFRHRIEAQNELYKLEILSGIKDDIISIYHIGDQWWDLCAGPHLSSTGELVPEAIELQSVAGVYWKGDESHLPMLQVMDGCMDKYISIDIDCICDLYALLMNYNCCLYFHNPLYALSESIWRCMGERRPITDL